MSQFEYVAVLISIIVGLALTQILRGVGRMVTAEDGPRPYWVHLVWTLYLFLNIVSFWWWEFRLETVEWSLSIYLVVITYATLLFFASLVMQPGSVDGIRSFRDYYFSKRRWIFALIIAYSLWDFLDTYSKGADHFFNLGSEYLTIQATIIIGSVCAFVWPSERFHKVFAIVWIIIWPSFMYRAFFVID